jgi:hypothetical protein
MSWCRSTVCRSANTAGIKRPLSVTVCRTRFPFDTPISSQHTIVQIGLSMQKLAAGDRHGPETMVGTLDMLLPLLRDSYHYTVTAYLAEAKLFAAMQRLGIPTVRSKSNLPFPCFR